MNYYMIFAIMALMVFSKPTDAVPTKPTNCTAFRPIMGGIDALAQLTVS